MAASDRARVSCALAELTALLDEWLEATQGIANQMQQLAVMPVEEFPDTADMHQLQQFVEAIDREVHDIQPLSVNLGIFIRRHEHAGPAEEVAEAVTPSEAPVFQPPHIPQAARFFFLLLYGEFGVTLQTTHFHVSLNDGQH